MVKLLSGLTAPHRGDAGLRLMEAVTQLERELGALEAGVVSCCGVTFTQCAALEKIGRAQSLSLNALAEALGLDKSTASRTVESLVQAGLASREPDPSDRRFVTLSLTESGLQAYRSIEGGKASYYGSLYQSIPTEKRAMVLESLEILLEALKQNECVKEEK